MWESRQVEFGSWRIRRGSQQGGKGSHLGLGRWGRPLHGDSVWKYHWNYSRRPVRTRACAQGHVHTHTPEPTQAWSSSEAT